MLTRNKLLTGIFLLHHFGYEVIRVPLKNNVLHLDCALSLVRNGLMIVSEDVL